MQRMKNARILIVEDSPKIAQLTQTLINCLGWEEYNYEFAFAYDGVQGWEQVLEIAPDVIISDIVMPRMDGLQLIRNLRNDPQTAHIPVIVLSVLDGDENLINGLVSGCDGYITKPVNAAVLSAQVKACLRRSEREQQIRQGRLLCIADVQMDIQSHTVFRKEQELYLTATEYQMLECFLRSPGQVIARRFLKDQIWGMESDIESNIVDVYIGYLRKKLELGGGSRLIHTVRGVGYKLEERPRRQESEK
jgi:two-component system, OmpR family, copper resistance phosphate regulon response regulator CusR